MSDVQIEHIGRQASTQHTLVDAILRDTAATGTRAVLCEVFRHRPETRAMTWKLIVERGVAVPCHVSTTIF